MADAGGTTTLEVINNSGEKVLYKLRNSSVDTGETIPFDITGSPVKAEDRVIVVGVLNETTESQGAGTALSVEYDETAMHFTVTESGITDDAVSILFYFLPQ